MLRELPTMGICNRFRCCIRFPLAFIVATILLLPGLSGATDVQVVGLTPGRSAVVVIDGNTMTLEVGESVDGVTLVRVDSDGAVLRVDGRTRTLPLEAQGAGEPGGGGTGASSVRLSADGSGHFIARGAINGRSVRFLVDTGASLTTLSKAEAKRIGLRYRGGQGAALSTANGLVRGWRISLGSVRVGQVTVNDVDAVVIDSDLPVALLGMSFLDRFDMTREGSYLVLRRRGR
jgi:aspartyl protease family protein